MANTDPKLWIISNTSGSILVLSLGTLGPQDQMIVFNSVYQLQAMPDLMAAIAAGQASVTEKVYGEIPTETTTPITTDGTTSDGRRRARIEFPFFHYNGNEEDTEPGLGVLQGADGSANLSAVSIPPEGMSPAAIHAHAFGSDADLTVNSADGTYQYSVRAFGSLGGGVTVAMSAPGGTCSMGFAEGETVPSIILSSPNGTQYKLTISDAGATVVTPV